ncbi:glycosyltransferase [Lactobacillus curvatus]|nr:glycosyltransferase [Latilactobacillus curvatus]MSE24241.1 glycosyltransferase [Latilactobacillus curvatus]
MAFSDYITRILIYTIVSYPIVGGLSFIVSSLYYWLFLERKDMPRYLEKGTPFITILVPAHNEEASIEATIEHLEERMNYPTDQYEVIVVNDGSTDQTGAILNRLQIRYGEKRLRVITIINNRGKAAGFNIALGFSKGQFLLSNDADSKPEVDALWKYMHYFEREGGDRLGAITGNMLSINKTSLVAEAQQNELNSIIGLIKRSQLSYGGLFAFSGANTMYRKAAVLDVGGWQAEQPTEDIAISWDMQVHGWQAYFAPHIRFFMDVPETLPELVKQRRRWTAGGIHVLLTKSMDVFRHPLKQLAMIPIIIDYSLSVVWSLFFWLSMIAFVGVQVLYLVQGAWAPLITNFCFAAIFISIEIVVGLIQLIMASYFNDHGQSLKYIAFAPWYILIYWMVNTYTVAVEIGPTIIQILKGEDAGVWKSPKRSVDVITKSTEEDNQDD